VVFDQLFGGSIQIQACRIIAELDSSVFVYYESRDVDVVQNG